MKSEMPVLLLKSIPGINESENPQVINPLTPVHYSSATTRALDCG